MYNGTQKGKLNHNINIFLLEDLKKRYTNWYGYSTQKQPTGNRTFNKENDKVRSRFIPDKEYLELLFTQP